jgi:dTDP-4-dehydrorhamnose 3,5-epimerase
MATEPTGIDGLLRIAFPLHVDERGFFRQSFQMGELRSALGREVSLVQGNHSRSAAGVLRGFHLEPWDKLVQVVRGTALCVVADVRPASPTFRQTRSFLLGDAPGEFARIFVSAGLANAFYALTEADYLNDVSEEFTPRGRLAVAWNDPDLGVRWPATTPILSAADRAAPTLREVLAARG